MTFANTAYEDLQDATKTLLECGIAPGARILVLAANSGGLAAAEAASLSDQARMYVVAYNTFPYSLLARRPARHFSFTPAGKGPGSTPHTPCHCV